MKRGGFIPAPQAIRRKLVTRSQRTRAFARLKQQVREGKVWRGPRTREAAE